MQMHQDMVGKFLLDKMGSQKNWSLLNSKNQRDTWLEQVCLLHNKIQLGMELELQIMEGRKIRLDKQSTH